MRCDFWELHGDQLSQNELYFTPNSFVDAVGQIKEMEAKLWVRFSVQTCSDCGLKQVHRCKRFWWSFSVLFSTGCCEPSPGWTVTMNLMVCVLFMVLDKQSFPDGSRVQGLLTRTPGPQASVINMSSSWRLTNLHPHHTDTSQTVCLYVNHSIASIYLNSTKALN